MVRVYRKGPFNVYSDHSGEFIIHNIRKDFQNGHTHIREFNTAKYLINLATHKSIPRRCLKYFIESLIRISDDKEYIDQLSHYHYKKRRRRG